MEVDTTNDQLVGVRNSNELVIMAPKRQLTKHEALRHAAWLVTLAESLEPLEGEFKFQDIL